MKVRASIKKRSADCKIVRRKGKLYVINKKTPASNKGRDSLGFLAFSLWFAVLKCGSQIPKLGTRNFEQQLLNHTL
jgi:large subunit ribosomal protein L36